jgi:murein L,D-transpeptidase YafK
MHARMIHALLWAAAALMLNLTGISPKIAPPSTKKSRAIVESVRPELEEALDGLGLAYGSPVFIRIFKESRELEVWVRKDAAYVHFRTYEICAYAGDLGPKTKWLDGQSPEGFYYVTRGMLRPGCVYHLAFLINYPNEYDRAKARTGSEILIHGKCVSAGCYAMTDERMNEIYALAEAALSKEQKFFRVHIFPFRMTKEHMKSHEESPWIEFWTNLKEGYDFFEKNRVPPDVTVEGGRYVFSGSD